MKQTKNIMQLLLLASIFSACAPATEALSPDVGDAYANASSDLPLGEHQLEDLGIEPNDEINCNTAELYVPMSTVSLLSEIENWEAPARSTRLRVDLSLAINVKSQKFTTTSKPSLWGQLAGASEVGTSNVLREFWFSRCPGGIPLDTTNDVCLGRGTSNTILRWRQGSAEPWECKLDFNTEYYVNYRAVYCAENDKTSCDVNRHFRVNGQ